MTDFALTTPAVSDLIDATVAMPASARAELKTALRAFTALCAATVPPRADGPFCAAAARLVEAIETDCELGTSSPGGVDRGSERP